MTCYNAEELAVIMRIDEACFELAHRDGRTPLKLVFSGICMSRGSKTILQDICGSAEPGELLAIMGPSGSGKTSLLNALSGRVPIDKGAITLNGKMLNKDLKRHIALSQQQDVFMGSLTLGYTLEFYSQMRMPSNLTNEQKRAFKNRITSIFKLDDSELLKTKMGSVLERGLSGGETKRANIACEIFSMPSVLLVDEPTTGLDSHNALIVIQVLKDYAAKQNTTVVVTVHQPSSLMFHMFDKLLLMGEGQVAYFGNIKDVVPTFGDLDMIIPPHYNPADFIVDQLYDAAKLEKLITAAQESREKELQDKPNGKTLETRINGSRNGTCNVLRSSTESDHDSSRSLFADSCHSFENTHKWPVPFHTQLRLLTKRSFTDGVSRNINILNYFHVAVLSLVVGCLWFQIPRKEENLSSMKGWIFFTATIWLLNAVYESMQLFPSERAVINRERSSGMYRLSAYYCAKTIGELPQAFTLPTAYIIVTYAFFGFHFYTFLAHWGILLLSMLVSQSVGLFIGAICHDTSKALVFCSLYCLPSILLGGFFNSSIPYWLCWLRYTSPVHYAFDAMQIIEFGFGNLIECAANNSLYDACRDENVTFIPICKIVGTEEDEDPLFRLSMDILILCCFILLFRFLAYLSLKFYKSPTRTI